MAFWQDEAAENEFYKRIFQTEPFKTICGNNFDPTPIQEFAKNMTLYTLKQVLSPDFDARLRDDCLREIGRTCCQMFLEYSDINTGTDIDTVLNRLNAASKGHRKFRRRGNLIYEEGLLCKQCWCPIVTNMGPDYNPLIWCDCSKSARESLFNAVMNKPVEVELLDSIICTRSDSCKWLVNIAP